MDNIKYNDKWKTYQKEYIKKNRDKMNAYGRSYYQQNKEKFKMYYDKYKKKKNNEKYGIANSDEPKDTKNKHLKAIEKDNKKNELLLKRAREYRDQLLAEGYNPSCLGTF